MVISLAIFANNGRGTEAIMTRAYNNIFKPKIIKNDEKDYCKNGHDGRGGYYV